MQYILNNVRHLRVLCDLPQQISDDSAQENTYSKIEYTMWKS